MCRVWRAGHLPDLGGQVEGGQAGGGPRGARGGRVAGDPRGPDAAHSGQPRQTLPADGACLSLSLSLHLNPRAGVLLAVQSARAA